MNLVHNYSNGIGGTRTRIIWRDKPALHLSATTPNWASYFKRMRPPPLEPLYNLTSLLSVVKGHLERRRIGMEPTILNLYERALTAGTSKLPVYEKRPYTNTGMALRKPEALEVGSHFGSTGSKCHGTIITIGSVFVKYCNGFVTNLAFA